MTISIDFLNFYDIDMLTFTNIDGSLNKYIHIKKSHNPSRKVGILLPTILFETFMGNRHFYLVGSYPFRLVSELRHKCLSNPCKVNQIKKGQNSLSVLCGKLDEFPLHILSYPLLKQCCCFSRHKI